MTYIRHRDRMVQESIYEDLVNTLIALRWIPGTTTREVLVDMVPTIVTTAPTDVLKIVGDHPVNLIDYFPESTTEEAGVAGEPASGKTPMNTLAIDDGTAGEALPLELGSTLAEIPYRFSFALWAANIGVAQALLNDLRDRYRGLVVGGDRVALYDYIADPENVASWLDVDSFVYVRSSEDEVAAHEATMFYGMLSLTDFVD